MKKAKTALIAGFITVFVLAVAGAIVYLSYKSGMIYFVNPGETEYPVRGMMVSSEQGEINYLFFFENTALDFAFVRATKGIDQKDSQYSYNWVQLKDYGVITSAYHSFTFEEDGEKQAKNFIRTVPVQSGILPPTVMIDLYGEYANNPLSKEEVKPELDKLLTMMESNYGKKPVLYCTPKTYALYLSEGYDDYVISVAADTSKPELEGKSWTFWQHTDKKSLIVGDKEKKAVMKLVVYNSSKQDFENTYGVKLPSKPNLKTGMTVSLVTSSQG